MFGELSRCSAYLLRLSCRALNSLADDQSHRERSSVKAHCAGRGDRPLGCPVRLLDNAVTARTRTRDAGLMQMGKSLDAFGKIIRGTILPAAIIIQLSRTLWGRDRAATRTDATVELPLPK